MKKFLAISVASLAVLAMVGFGVSQVYANQTNNSYPPIIQKLVDRFNLDENEVKTVFDEARQERHDFYQQNKEDRLNQAVEDGLITQEQKQALASKWQEMTAEREKHHQEMLDWFDQQGIDHDALMQYGMMGNRGFGRHFKK